MGRPPGVQWVILKDPGLKWALLAVIVSLGVPIYALWDMEGLFYYVPILIGLMVILLLASYISSRRRDEKIAKYVEEDRGPLANSKLTKHISENKGNRETTGETMDRQATLRAYKKSKKAHGRPKFFLSRRDMPPDDPGVSMSLFDLRRIRRRAFIKGFLGGFLCAIPMAVIITVALMIFGLWFGRR